MATCRPILRIEHSVMPAQPYSLGFPRRLAASTPRSRTSESVVSPATNSTDNRKLLGGEKSLGCIRFDAGLTSLLWNANLAKYSSIYALFRRAYSTQRSRRQHFIVSGMRFLHGSHPLYSRPSSSMAVNTMSFPSGPMLRDIVPPETNQVRSISPFGVTQVSGLGMPNGKSSARAVEAATVAALGVVSASSPFTSASISPFTACSHSLSRTFTSVGTLNKVNGCSGWTFHSGSRAIAALLIGR